MNCRSIFERQVCRCYFAFVAKLAQESFSSTVKVGLHPLDLGRIFLITASLKAWRQAHFHLGINASGELGIRMQIVHAAPHFEEVERIIHKVLRSNARYEWSVIECRPIQPAQARGNRCARVFILEMQFDQRSEAEAEAV